MKMYPTTKGHIMSNETNPKTEQVHTVTDVPQTEPVPVTVVKPKRFIKTRNTLRHPIQTVKAHKSVALVTVGVAAGAVSTLLLSSKLNEQNEETVEDTEDESALAELLELHPDVKND